MGSKQRTDKNISAYLQIAQKCMTVGSCKKQKRTHVRISNAIRSFAEETKSKYDVLRAQWHQERFWGILVILTARLESSRALLHWIYCDGRG
jgi:hypothetical protein